MATAALDVHRLDGIPAICAKTAVPTEKVRSQEFGDIPGWTLFLIFWGLIPFLIASGFARRKLKVDIPVSADILRRIQMVDLGSIGGLVLGVGLIVTAILTQDGVWAWVGLAFAVLFLLVGAIARHMVWVSGRLEKDVLWLYGLHPAFAEALEPLAPAGVKPTDPRWAVMLLGGAIVLLGVFLIWWLSVSA